MLNASLHLPSSTNQPILNTTAPLNLRNNIASSRGSELSLPQGRPEAGIF